ncbi:19015_t:CDS:1, partial [Racocetra persica]
SEDPLNNLLFFNQESPDDIVFHIFSTMTTTISLAYWHSQRPRIPESLHQQSS